MHTNYDIFILSTGYLNICAIHNWWFSSFFCVYNMKSCMKFACVFIYFLPLYQNKIKLQTFYANNAYNLVWLTLICISHYNRKNHNKVHLPYSLNWSIIFEIHIFISASNLLYWLLRILSTFFSKKKRKRFQYSHSVDSQNQWRNRIFSLTMNLTKNNDENCSTLLWRCFFFRGHKSVSLYFSSLRVRKTNMTQLSMVWFWLK